MKQTKHLFRPLLMAVVMMVGMLVPQGAWAQEECEHEYYYVQLLGGGSHYQKCDKCNGYTDTEYCNYVDGICMYCGFECQHPEYTMEEESHTCISCGFSDSHDWNEGKCDICHRECLHPQVEQDDYDSHKCTTCGASADHEWDDMGHCFICNYVCQHEDNEGESTWNDGVCSNCGYECQHDYIISIVKISAPAIDYDDYVRYSEGVLIENIEFEIKCETCGMHKTQDDSDIARVTETYISDDNNPTCTEEGSYNLSAVISVYNSEGLLVNSKQTNEEISGIIAPLGHSYQLSATPDEHGLYHYICDECEAECGSECVIKDGVAFNNPVEFTTSNVTMARTFTQSAGDNVVPATIVLPFSIAADKLATEEDGVVRGTKFYAFSSLEKNAETGKWEATMDRVKGTVEAYTPYMIVLTEGTTIDLGSNEVTFPATPDTYYNTQQGDWTFVATNEEKVWTDADFANGEVYYGYAAGNETTPEGKFVKVGAGASIAPLRAYIMKTPLTRAAGTLPSIISVRLNESAATGIGTLNTETGEFTFEGWYDLQGRRMGEPVKNGININNNKKVFVK